MKIGVITPEYPPYVGGGIGTATVSFVRNMALAGHEIEVFALFSPGIEGYDTNQDQIFVEGEHIRVHCLSYCLDDADFSDEHRKILNYLMGKDLLQAKSWLLCRKLRVFLQGYDLDVIFSAEYMGLPAFFMLEQRALPKKDRIPVVLTLHTGHRELNHANYLSHRSLMPWEKGVAELESLSIELADALHCPSRFLGEFINKTYYEGRLNIYTIPYFKPFDCRAETTAPVEMGRDRVLFIGRYERRKGVKEFVQAAVHLLDTGHDCDFELVGGEWVDEFTGRNYSFEVKRCVPERHAERIRFLGLVPHTELPERIRAASLVVVPSLFENYPNTCMEATQVGTPVLVASSGGMKEIVGEFAGSVFDPWSVERFAKAIGDFLDLNESERRGYSEFQQAHFESKHQPESLRQEYESLIEASRMAITCASLAVLKKGREKPAIGIGLPVYNTGPYLDECIQSVIDQSRLPDKILVINDGSTDAETLRKLAEWDDRSPLVEVIHQENRGLCATRNRILGELGEFEYVMMLDSDDCLHPEYLETAERYLDHNPEAAAVVSWVQMFGETDDLWLELPLSFPKALMQNMIVSSVALIRRSTIPDDLLFDERLSPFTAEDWDFWIRYHKAGNQIHLIPQLLFHYRVRKGSKFQLLNGRKHMVIIEHVLAENEDLYIKYHRDIMVALFAELNRRGNETIWQILARSLPGWLLLALRKNRFLRALGFRLLTQ